MTWTANKSSKLYKSGVYYVETDYADGVSQPFSETYSIGTVYTSWPDDIINARLAELNAANALDSIALGAPTAPPAPIAPTPDPRDANGWAVMTTYDPASPTIPKIVFLTTDTIGVTVTIMTAQSGGSVVTPFSGPFSVPIASFNGLRATVAVIPVTFTNGVASFTAPASLLGSSGYFGIDDMTSTLVRAAQQMVTVQETLA